MRIFLTSIFMLSILFLSVSGCSTAAPDTANTGTANTTDVSNQASAEPGAAGFTDANQALAAGTKLLEEGETDQAIDALLRAVEMDAGLADAYFQLGIAYSLVEKRNAEAVPEELTPAPNPKDKKVVKSNSVRAFEKAVAAYKKLIAANEDNAAAHYNLGRAYNKLDKDEDAAKALKQAVKLNPDDTDYQTELGAILIKLARYREAIGPLEKALEIDPANSRAEELLSDAQAGRRRIDYVAPKKDDKGEKNGGKPANVSSKANNNTRTNTNSKPLSNSVNRPD